jgi:predicted nucleic acid-binding protein
MDCVEERGADLSAIVLDVSATAPLFLNDEAADILPGLPEVLADSGALIPSHWYVEVANAIRIAGMRKRLDQAGQADAIDVARSILVEVDELSADRVFKVVWALAERNRLTINDAAYLELATRAGLPLATNDRALIKAAAGEGVELFGR